MFNGFVPFLKNEHPRITMITALFSTEIRRHAFYITGATFKNKSFSVYQNEMLDDLLNF